MSAGEREKMSKRFKLRIARVLPSFHTCRSKDLIPAISNPINLKSLDLTFPPSSPSLIKRRVSSALVSVGCRFRSSSSSSSKSKPPVAAAPDPTPTPDFQWQKDEKWHVIAKVPAHHRRAKISSYRMNSSSDDEYSNCKPKAKAKTKKKKSHAKMIKRKKKSFINRSSVRFSSSSFDNCWFSSSDRECGFIHDDFLETDTLISSSRSFSDDEEKRNPTLLQTNGGFKRMKTARRKEQRLTCPSPESDSPVRLSVFRRMVPCGAGAAEGGKVKESFAVVKKSEDPYGDFRRSMLEMILEKEMYEREDLEQLLHCFLSLNSRAHHAVIVQAFSEIWEILFGGRSDGAADAGTEEGGARMRSLEQGGLV